MDAVCSAEAHSAVPPGLGPHAAPPRPEPHDAPSLRHRRPDLDSEERCDLQPPGPHGGTEPPPWRPLLFITHGLVLGLLLQSDGGRRVPRQERYG